MLIAIENEGTLNGTSIVEDSMELKESLCSQEQLRFGCCEASIFKIRLINQQMPLAGKKIIVSDIRGGQDFVYGTYKVASDQPTADRRYRDVVAYDSMYDIINADVAGWYDTILPNDEDEITLKEFRDSFFAYFGIEQEDVTLINDDMVISKTVEPSKMAGKVVVTAICEINGCFGHIGRDGVFKYIFLPEIVEGTYPAEETKYINAEYEDYTTARITKLQIRQEESDIGCIYGTGDNCYIVQDNFLLYGKSTEELVTIAGKMFSVIKDVWYRPACIEAKGNPNLEVGDAIKLQTERIDIYTYILKRILKGIQALRDTYEAEGEQYQTEKVNSVHEEIIQLKGKTNTLKRTIEETKLTITDVEKGLQSQITHNANSVSSEVTRATIAEGDLSNRIKQTADSFSVEIANIQNQIDGNIIMYNVDYVPTLYNYPAWDWTTNIPCNNTVQLSEELEFEYTEADYKAHARTVAFNDTTFVTYRFLKENEKWHWVEVADSEYSFVLQQVTELKIKDASIESSVQQMSVDIERIYISKVDAQSLVTQTADSITTTVSKTYETKVGAETHYQELRSIINQTAESIELKVAKGEISSQLSVESGAISIKSNRFSWDSTFSSLTSDGKLKARDVDLTGKITANSGNISGFTITGNSMYYGKYSLNSSARGVYIGTDGIAVGWGSEYTPAFKVTADGDVSISNLGEIGFGGMNDTIITNSKVQIQNTYIDKDKLHCGTTNAYTEVTNNEVVIRGAYGYLRIGANEARWSSSTGTYYLKDNSDDELASITNDAISIYPAVLTLGKGTGSIGFFGGAKRSTKKTVSKVLTPTSTTTYAVATVLNNLLDALNAYNLINV